MHHSETRKENKMIKAAILTCFLFTGSIFAQEAQTPAPDTFQEIFEFLQSGTRPKIYQMTTTTGVGTDKNPIDETTTFTEDEKIYFWVRAAIPAGVEEDTFYTVSVERLLPNNTTDIVYSRSFKFRGSSSGRGQFTYRNWTYTSAKNYSSGDYTVTLKYMGIVEQTVDITIQ